MKISEWIDPGLHRDFIAEQTDALRLCTCPDGWVERFGVDVLISYKTDAALERLKTELCLWALNVDFKFRRVFARFLPKQNAEREAPRLILGDPGTNLESTALERTLRYGIDFGAGYSVGLFIDQRENRRFVRRRRAAEFAQLLRLHLLVFRGGGNSRRRDGQHRSLEKIARPRPGKFCAEFTADQRSPVSG